MAASAGAASSLAALKLAALALAQRDCEQAVVAELFAASVAFNFRSARGARLVVTAKVRALRFGV